MEVKDIPIQAVVAIAAVILAFLQGTLIFLFTRFLNDVKELKTKVESLEEKKVSKDTLEITLKSMDDRLGQIVESQKAIRKDISGFGTRVDTRLQDHDRQVAKLRK